MTPWVSWTRSGSINGSRIHLRVCQKLTNWLRGIWSMKATHIYTHTIIIHEIAPLRSQAKCLIIQDLLLPWVPLGTILSYIFKITTKWNLLKMCWFFSSAEAFFLIGLKMPSMLLLLFLEGGLCCLLILCRNSYPWKKYPPGISGEL